MCIHEIIVEDQDEFSGMCFQKNICMLLKVLVKCQSDVVCIALVFTYLRLNCSTLLSTLFIRICKCSFIPG